MKIKLRNRLEVLMKDSGINTFEEMSQRLTQNQNWNIGRTSLSRKFRDNDVTLTLKMVEAICNELQCLPGDIFETEIYDASDDFVEGLRSRLQPFRYGNIRISKTESEISKNSVPENNSNLLTPKNDQPIGKSKSISNFDDLSGPKVSHLNKNMLKKK